MRYVICMSREKWCSDMDLIDREALYKQVALHEEAHRNQLLEMDIDNPCIFTQNRLVNIISIIKYAVADAPTVDAVEVVRCKDCKFQDSYRSGSVFCFNHGMSKQYDDFCSYGEHRDGD